jgi:hypothetical protein
MACSSFTIPSPVPLVIRLPGGATITGVTQGAAPSDLDIVRALSGQVAAVLGPFQGIFDLIDTIQLVLDTVAAIPGAIASLNPGKITSKLSELTAKVAGLSSYLPALAIPRLAKDVIELVARNNAALRTELISVGVQQAGAATINARADALEADGFPDAANQLRVTGQCLTNQFAERMSSLNSGQGPLDTLVSLINTLLGLVPGIPIPPLPLTGSLGDDPLAAVALLDAVDVALDPIRTALAGI